MEIADTELAELRKKAHAYDSDQGRLQKTQAELDAERAARAELEKRIAAQQTQLAPDAKALEIFGADGMAHLQNMLSPVVQRLDAIGRKFEERDTADASSRALRKFQEDLDAKLSGNNLPGFTSRLYGGDLTSAWTKYLEAHPSIRRAQAEGDVESVSDSMSIFIHQNKELVAGGGFSPASLPGGVPAVKCDYTDADYQRDMSALQRQLDNVVITETDFKAKSDALFDRWVAAQQKAESAAAAFGLV